MNFSNYRDAVSALVPAHKSFQFWRGVAALADSTKLTGHEIKVTRVSILGNMVDGYSHGTATVLYYRPLSDFDSLAEAEAAKPQIAELNDIPLYDLEVLTGGFVFDNGQAMHVELPAGLGKELLAGMLDLKKQ